MEQRHFQSTAVEELWGSLCDELRRRGADRATAEDIAQDTWLIALQRPPEERGRLRGWLRVVGTRLWQRAEMRAADRQRRELVAARPERSERELAALGEDQERSRLRRYVDELPEPYRTTLRLRFFEGLEVGEIAERLSTKTATVQSRIKRGLARLRARIGTDDEQRERLAGWLPWLLWLRPERAGLRAEPAGVPLRLLAGVGLATLTVLSCWLLALQQPRSAARLALPGEIAAATSAVQAEALLAHESEPSTSSDRRAAWPATPTVHASRLSGIVRGADGEPLAGARVHVADAVGSGDERTATTDAQGRYEMAADGELLWATHDDQCESARRYVASIRDRTQADLVLGATRGRAQVEVVTAAGEPVAGARVLVDGARPSRQLTTPRGELEFRTGPSGATTDEQGRCWILFPAAGAAELLVVPEQHPGWHGSVRMPADGDALRIELPACAALAGTCRDEAGQLLAGVEVEVAQLSGLLQRVARSDPDGAFRVDGLAPGEFILRAREPGPRPVSARFAGWLEPQEELELALELSALHTILGRVVDASGPVAGARATLGFANAVPAESARRAALTDAQGRFDFAGSSSAVAFDLQIFMPGAAEPCLGVERVWPGRGEQSYVVPPADLERAPIELEARGARAPPLVELRRAFPALSAVLEPVAPDSGSFRSAPLPAGTYEVFAWHPELGTWHAAALEHDPREPRTHPLAWPATATLALELELPEGVRREEIEVALLGPGFHRNGLGSFGTDDARRLLSWSEPERAFVASLTAGTHALLVRGAGLSELQQTVVLAAGEARRLTLAPWRAIETTVVFEEARSSSHPGQEHGLGLRPSEYMQLEALTPTGSTRLELSWMEQRRVDGGFELTLWLPCQTLELRARTRSDHAPGFVPRRGRCALEPGTLDAAQGRPRVRIALVSGRS